METITLLKYKYQTGAYSLLYIMDLVMFGKITEEQFKEITNLNFIGVTGLKI